jgi:predicted lipoprotein with Yx(FWY)xxD motif
MRKSGLAMAAALGSLALLLAGCGGSSSSASSTPPSARPSSLVGLPSAGTTVLIVQKSDIGYVLALANGDVVYTYGNDKKGGQPTCTNSCASIWEAVTGQPQASTATTLPGVLGTVTLADGTKQVTYNGYPLYIYKPGQVLATTGNGMGGGLWRVVHLSAADISAG